MKSNIDMLSEKADSLTSKVSSIQEKLKSLELKKGYEMAATPLMGNRSSSLESKTTQAYGVNNIKSLVSQDLNAPKFANVPHEYKMAAKELKLAINTARFISERFYRDGIGGGDEYIPSAKSITSHAYGKEVLVPMLKAFGTNVAGGGLEFIETMVAPTYISEVELDKTELLTKFQEIKMPSNPFNLPVINSLTTARGIAQGATGSIAQFVTDKIALDSKKLFEYYELPEELNEDSAPQIYQLLVNELTQAQLRAYNQVILNGDDSVTHMDSDTTVATDARRFVAKGLRKLALANSANGSTVNFAGVVTKALLDSMLKAGGKFVVNPKDALFVFGPSVYHQAKAIDEVATMEKYGNLATISTGGLSSI